MKPDVLKPDVLWVYRDKIIKILLRLYLACHSQNKLARPPDDRLGWTLLMKMAKALA
jgi:hypothetical protein